ncbi:MAG: heat shock protein HspQ [Deltaproteobacteria bacterium]|nr:heat shock protein HspQ [Deltaproteobacteria bacterium]MBW2361721.1 heat shock protein HspQ [Deltaproteobacteria bacterium]
MEEVRTRFSVGDVIEHRLFGYRGVVLDVDPAFQLSDEWYAKMARSRPPRDAPWYHVLVEDSDAPRYVAEQNLRPDPSGAKIRNPLLGDHFASFVDGRYTAITRSN